VQEPQEGCWASGTWLVRANEVEPVGYRLRLWGAGAVAVSATALRQARERSRRGNAGKVPGGTPWKGKSPREHPATATLTS